MLAEIRGSFSAAALCAAALSSAPAYAQSLSLSYQLDPVQAPHLPKAVVVGNRCSTFTWVASLAPACIAEATAARLLTAVNALRAEMHAVDGPHESGAPRRAVAQGAYTAEAVAPRYDLPLLGSPSDSRVLRAAGGRDDYATSARNVDLNLRFGAKNRARGADEGWEVYRFSDVTSENRLPSNGMKSIGVELSVPFQ